MRGIVWFKKDLRVQDNPALFSATQSCKDGVIGVYVLDCVMWRKHHVSYNQIQFILNGLQQLQAELAALHIPLFVETVTATEKIPELLIQFIEKLKAKNLYFNRELEVNESRRDQAVKEKCAAHSIQAYDFNDQLILDVNRVRTNGGDAFKVFTPFKKQWLDVFYQDSTIRLLPKVKPQIDLKLTVPAVPAILPNIKAKIDFTHWPAGAAAAEKKLKLFCRDHIQQYDRERDFPMLDGTSRLSPYLAVGMISVKKCFLAALAANSGEFDAGNRGILTWLAELIWREFYRHILHAFPHVCMNRAYKANTEKLAWRYDEELLSAWQEGRTGFPIVDAAMRQLNQTGWMHNRLRMIVAMFLSKNLFLDWRLGEKYFAENLIDFDFASNNGGWQWSASTGTDAVPYFRIFNPTTQSERFDPQGDFIRRYCPELQSFTACTIHNPYRYLPDETRAVGYPAPIIDYAQSRAQVLAAFKNIAK